jgi:SAM-dependent methyltransferase
MEAARKYHAFLMSTVLSRADPASPILDFGAGTGTHARGLRGRGLDVSCVEPDPELRRLLERDGFRVAECAREFGRETFSLIYSFNVLEHIQDESAPLRDMFTLLKSHGRLVLYVPAFRILFSEMDRKVGHYRRYRAQQLTEIVRAEGFRVVSCTYVDSLGFVAALVYRVLRGSGDLNQRSIALYDRFLFPISRMVDGLTHRWLGKNLLIVASRD